MCALKFFQRSSEQKQRKQADYRISLYYLLMKTLKACKLFLIQKVVKRLKDKKEKETSVPDSNQTTNLQLKKEKLNKELLFLKAISNNDIKHSAIFILKKDLSLNLEKQKIFFNKNVLDFEKISNEDTQQNISEFVKMAKTVKKYRNSQEQVEKILEKVKKKIHKTKQERKMFTDIKRKKILKKNLSKESTEQKDPEDLQTEESIVNDKAKIINESPMKINKQKFSKKMIVRNMDVTRKREQPNFEKTRKYEKKDERVFNKNVIEPKAEKFNSKITTDYQEIHPSWEARLAQKKEEATTTFMGVRKKLC